MFVAALPKDGFYFLTSFTGQSTGVEIAKPMDNWAQLNGFFAIKEKKLVVDIKKTISNAHMLVLSGLSGPETLPTSIPGDGVAIAEIIVQLHSGDTYGLEKTGEGEWDYKRVKLSDGAVITGNTYEGKKIAVGTTKGILNKTEITLDATSKGTFKLKSEARTCVGAEAAVVTLTPVDSQNCSGATLKIEFGPVEF